MSAPVAVVEDLTVRFARPRRLTDLRPAPFTAVDGVSFELRPGAITGLVGQSGSGKSTVARALLRLVPFEGRITVGDVAVHDLPLHPPRSVRRRVQAVFQDPLQALNPRHTVARIIGEPLRLHRMVERESVDARVDELLASVGLGTDLRDRTTRELSGGQRQRVAIARALATEPDLLVLDEALSALDVTSAARVASLLRAVLDDTTAMLFIGHDLAMVRQLCDDVLVMHAGQVVERGVAEQVCGDPQHDYTQRLIASIPDPTG